MFELTTSMAIFIFMIVSGIAVAIFGKIRMNTTIMILGGLLVMAALYMIINATLMVQQ